MGVDDINGGYGGRSCGYVLFFWLFSVVMLCFHLISFQPFSFLLLFPQSYYYNKIKLVERLTTSSSLVLSYFISLQGDVFLLKQHIYS
jgi:hypothetical protein